MKLYNVKNLIVDISTLIKEYRMCSNQCVFIPSAITLLDCSNRSTCLLLKNAFAEPVKQLNDCSLYETLCIFTSFIMFRIKS